MRDKYLNDPVERLFVLELFALSSVFVVVITLQH